jgi:hypothetical protein
MTNVSWRENYTEAMEKRSMDDGDSSFVPLYILLQSLLATANLPKCLSLLKVIMYGQKSYTVRE